MDRWIVIAAILIGRTRCVRLDARDPSIGADAAKCGSLHIAITSVVHYERPRIRLLASMRAANVPMGQVHVFLGGTKANLFPTALREWQLATDRVRVRLRRPH